MKALLIIAAALLALYAAYIILFLHRCNKFRNNLQRGDRGVIYIGEEKRPVMVQAVFDDRVVVSVFNPTNHATMIKHVTKSQIYHR